ncbi:vacuolar protein sorting-associated protein light [Lycorma delicatula]|uniref:vacuolar protein sorting-associated protein light n=1 Tax=Lycorma delicatula TaxID=130591 RepID=UPI003F50D9EC
MDAENKSISTTQEIKKNGKDEEEEEEEEDEDEDEEDDEEEEEEEVEPRLKYTRMTHDLANILCKDAASCIALHPKFVCVGTHWGSVHLLDHQGNKVQQSIDMHSHTVAVNQISMDAKGEHIATCSDDGKVFVYALDNADDTLVITVGRLVRCVAIDPFFYRANSGSRFVTGDEKLVLYEKSFLSRMRSTVLSDVRVEGGVQSVRWSPNGLLLAWTTHVGVRIYDFNARCSLGLIKWSRNTNVEKYRCNLCWKDKETLLVGWVDTIRICRIHRRSPAEIAIAKNVSEFLVEPVSTFQTDFFVSGVAPLSSQLVVLGYCKEQDVPQRPQLHVIEPRAQDYIDISTDSLSLRGYQEYTANDYHLECLLEENRYVVVSPKDIVVASPYNADDRVDWLLQHCKFEMAMEAVSNGNKELRRHSMLSVGRTYLDHLLSLKKYQPAAKLCSKILGKDKQLWEEEVFKFARVHQLRAVSPYLPRDNDHHLDPQIYEMVLYEYLKMDPVGFLDVVKKWSPKLYNVPAVVNAVMELYLVGESDNRTLFLEALAILYSHEGQYAKALAMYLKLHHTGVFELIHKHKLYDVIHDKIEGLMELDATKAISMLIEKEHVSPDVVIKQLEHNKMYLFIYLDALEERWDKKVLSRKYHGTLVKLYADFAREKLLPLLRRSDHYPIQEALNICKERGYHPEMVYLLGRIGNTKEALNLIIKKLNDIEQAIVFCKEHDDADLWEDLINQSLDKPDFITFLLQRIGTYIDPRILIQRIDGSLKIPGLKNSLVKMMQDYNLQVSVQEGCKKILVSDYFNLHERLVLMQQRGTCIDDEQYCGACHRKIIVKDLSQADNILMFYCHHSFHEQCLPITDVIVNCTICSSQKPDQPNFSTRMK